MDSFNLEIKEIRHFNVIYLTTTYSKSLLFNKQGGEFLTLLLI